MQDGSVSSLAYVRLKSSDLAAHSKYATEILGLRVSFQSDEIVHFRCSDHLRDISFCSNTTVGSVLGFEVKNDDALNSLKDRLEASGYSIGDEDQESAKHQFVRKLLKTRDPSGNHIEFVTGPQHSGVRFFPSRDSGVQRLQNIGLKSTDIEADTIFWTEVVGGKVSDWVGDITYITFDDMHHSIALYPSLKSGILYTAFEVESFDCVMQNKYFASERQVRVLQGPGKQTASGQTFVHLQGPENEVFSFVNGMSTQGDQSRHPRQFASTKDSLCSWGSVCDSIPELSPSKTIDNCI